MKDDILKRPMFAQQLSKKVMNSGIMAGFEDEMEDEESPMARTPQNPEILMNNLRGDIRSIDARYLELAQMVGEEAAMDTPPEVLAMLQGQMGAQTAPQPPMAGGIGALPQAPQMPPGMEGAGPFPQGGAEQAPPQSFAGGGEVTGDGTLNLQIPLSLGNKGTFGGSPFQPPVLSPAASSNSNLNAANPQGFMQMLQQSQAQQRVVSPPMPTASPPTPMPTISAPTPMPTASAPTPMPVRTHDYRDPKNPPFIGSFIGSQLPNAGPTAATSPMLAPFGNVGGLMQSLQQSRMLPFRFARGGEVSSPPLRAADGMFVTPGGRFDQAQQSLQGDMNRMLELASGNIPQEQMTQRDIQLLQQYNASMGFAGGLRDVARQGAGRIGSALQPYVTRGREMLSGLTQRIDEALPSFQGFRTTPLRGADQGRMVVQGRENIVAGPGGMPISGVGTKFERANTLEMGNIPFSQAVRESIRTSPVATGVAGTVGAGSAAAMLAGMGGKDISQLSPEQLTSALARINQIPTEGMPRPAAATTTPPSAPPAAAPTEPLITPPEGKGPAPSQTAQEQLQALKRQAIGGLGPEVAAEAPKVEEFIKTKIKEEGPLKTRAQRIKEEFRELEPTFRELLGDTKADARTNAMLLLADAGFKLASTYKPTTAMAIGEAFAGVPRGFAAIVSQARDRDIKIKTAALQQATDNINLQDKYARDFQIESLKIEGKFMQEVLKARNARELEKIKGRYKIGETAYKGDIDLLLEQIRMGGVKESDAGMGLVVQETKGGSYIGSYIKPSANGELPPVVRSAVDSRWTLRPTDNPFVDNRGPAPTTVETDKGERVKLGTTLRGLDDSLRALDDLRGQYSQLYSPGTWFTDKINNIIVPISNVGFGGIVRPDVDQAAAATRISAGLNQIMKRIASANDQGRVAVQEQEWARDMLGGLTNPTAFFSNKEIAAKNFAAMEAQLRNARQQVLTQLGFVSDDISMKVPSTGTRNDPFVIPTDPQDQQRMFRYLASTIGTIQDPRASVFIQMPNGRIEQRSPVDLRQIIQP